MKMYEPLRQRAPGLRLLVGVGLLAGLGFAPRPVHAQAPSYTFTVNTTGDTHDANVGDHVCLDGGGRCSLRAAVEEASYPNNAAGTAFTIHVPAGTYGLSLGELSLGQPNANLDKNASNTQTITITGAAASTTTVTANMSSRDLSVYTNATIQNLTITGGLATDLRDCGIGNRGACGAGIFDVGTLVLNADIVTGNRAQRSTGTTGCSSFCVAFAGGAGIAARAYLPLTLVNTTVSNNTATATVPDMASCTSANCTYNASAYGGGIYSPNSTLVVHGGSIRGNGAFATGNVTCPTAGQACFSNAQTRGGGLYNDEQDQLFGISVSNNTSEASDTTTCGTCPTSSNSKGGGIYNDYQEAITLSTISGNLALGTTAQGGGLYLNSDDVLNGVSVTGNGAGFQGGGIYNSSTLQLENTSVSANTAGMPGTNGQGGGIYNYFAMTAISSRIIGNSAYDGGGVYQDSHSSNTVDPLALTSSTVQNNHAAHFGGGIDDENAGTHGAIQMIGTRILTNTAGTEGGGIYNLSTVTRAGNLIIVNSAPTCPNTVTPCT